MKTILAALLLFSSVSSFNQIAFAQTATTEDIYASPEMVVSGVDFEELTDCWARLYERENFAGRSALLVGYTTWAQASPGNWPGWVGRVESVQVGPGARLVLYGSPYFVDKDHTVTGGVAVGQMPDEPLGDQVGSVKLLCDPD